MIKDSDLQYLINRISELTGKKHSLYRGENKVGILVHYPEGGVDFLFGGHCTRKELLKAMNAFIAGFTYNGNATNN